MDPIQQFENETRKEIEHMREDKRITKIGRDFVKDTADCKYSYHFTWMGRPVIQIPQDIVAMQEIIWEVKPDLIIETGIAHGGSLIFYASMLELIGEGEVLGIDIDIRAHNRREINKHKMSKRIRMIEGSSTDGEVVKQVEGIAKKYKKIMVCLDSLHTHDHVLKELRLYAPLVTKNSYLVVFDTIIEYMPRGFFKDRSWDKGNNPATAAKKFLQENSDFEVDKDIDAKLLISSAPGGYLKRVI